MYFRFMWNSHFEWIKKRTLDSNDLRTSRLSGMTSPFVILLLMTFLQNDAFTVINSSVNVVHWAPLNNSFNYGYNMRSFGNYFKEFHEEEDATNLIPHRWIEYFKNRAFQLRKKLKSFLSTINEFSTNNEVLAHTKKTIQFELFGLYDSIFNTLKWFDWNYYIKEYKTSITLTCDCVMFTLCALLCLLIIFFVFRPQSNKQIVNYQNKKTYQCINILM